MSTSVPEDATPSAPASSVHAASPALERFASETLGCQCEPEVFQHIELDVAPPAACTDIARRVRIGGRLLIYVVQPHAAAAAADRLGAWVEHGLAERDRLGYRRLRLVIPLRGMTPEAVAMLESAFGRLPALTGTSASGEEARVHLHCLPPEALVGLW